MCTIQIIINARIHRIRGPTARNNITMCINQRRFHRLALAPPPIPLAQHVITRNPCLTSSTVSTFPSPLTLHPRDGSTGSFGRCVFIRYSKRTTVSRAMPARVHHTHIWKFRFRRARNIIRLPYNNNINVVTSTPWTVSVRFRQFDFWTALGRRCNVP